MVEPALVERAAGVAVPRPWPADWLEIVHQPQSEAELERLRRCIRKGTPYGGDDWTRTTAARMGLEPSLRAPGRPRKLDEVKDEGWGPLFAENN